MKNSVCKILMAFIVIISMSCILHSKIKKNKKKSSSWISLDYLNCLKNHLPCECEQKTGDFFIFKFDLKENEHMAKLWYYGHEDMEFNTLWITRESNTYKVLNYNDTTIKIGEFTINDAIMNYTNVKGVNKVFVNLPLENHSDNENLYHYENYRILNNVIINKKYSSLNSIFNKENLKCYCNKWLNGTNILSNDTLYWILEQKKDSLFIYEKIDTSNVISQPPKYFKVNKKAFKW